MILKILRLPGDECLSGDCLHMASTVMLKICDPFLCTWRFQYFSADCGIGDSDPKMKRIVETCERKYQQMTMKGCQ